ncbi:MAG TPA: DNA-processing protein DprA [Candidatus Binataceae bacterium]|jgi:DNA processing protein|nr:DNA-processing protein DprA [Candidatus Binataceae bacterium]
MSATADAYWLALRRVHGAGPRTCRLLLERFGSAEQIFKATEDQITAAGVGRKVAAAIAGFNDFAPLEKELCELPRLGARLVRWTDDEYPPNLKQIADPPPYLVARGLLEPNDTACVAVVGARAASEAGLRMAQRLGFELAARGFVVVSGLARGIDGAAHRGALEAGGRTIAVLGCGIDVAYPPEHRGLADWIVERRGAVLSELPLGSAPLPENFPSRNRILSGLSLGVVIVEAAEKSGSLITARMALEQDRQVFAVPGSPLNGKTRGSNRLLREGAVLVECVEDVIEDLAPQMAPKASAEAERAAAASQPANVETEGPMLQPPVSRVTADASRRELGKSSAVSIVSSGRANPSEGLVEDKTKEIQSVLNCLIDAQRLHVDAVIESCQLPPQTVLNLLLELELRGLVVQHPGKLFTLP